MNEPVFRYSPAVAEQFANVRAEVVIAHRIANDVVIEALSDAYRAEQNEVVASLSELGPGDRPSIKAWRARSPQRTLKPPASCT